MALWTSNYESNPEGGDLAGQGDDQIRGLKEAVRERVEHEHYMDLNVGDPAEDGWHLGGSAKIYHQESTPTTRPDGVTALDAEDNGRIWRKPSTGEISYWDYDAGSTASERWVTTLSGSSSFTAAESITKGQLVAVDSSGEAVVADNTSLSKAYVSGVALNDASASAEVVVQKAGENANFSGLTKGAAYFLDTSGGVQELGGIGKYEYKVFVGIAKDVDTIDLHIGFPQVKQQAFDQAPLGTIFDYAGVSLPAGWDWVPLTATRVKRSTYAALWKDVFNEVDWFAPDATAASNAASADEFHLPTIQDAYTRGGIHGNIASVDTGNDEITFTNQRGTTVTDSHLRNGTPMRFYGSDLPSGLSSYTDYFLCWDSGNSQWKVYTTESDAVGDTGSNQVSLSDSGSGTQIATQFGVQVDDAMQGHHHENEAGSGHLQHSTSQNATMDDSSGIQDKTIRSPSNDGTNGTPRTTNETRPRTSYISKIIKTSHVLPTGEAVTATMADSGWISNSDWTNAELSFTHNLGANLRELIVKFFLSSDGTDGNATELLSNTNSGTSDLGLSIYQSSSNEVKVQTGQNGLYIINDDGTGTVIDTETYSYRIVVYKPEVLSSVRNLSDAQAALASSPNYYARDFHPKIKNNATASGRYTLVMPKQLIVNIGSGYGWNRGDNLEIDLSDSSNWDDTSGTDWTVASNRAGKDFYIYAVHPDSGNVPDILLSDDNTSPDGYTTSESRKIGGFHCLCADIGSNTYGYDNTAGDDLSILDDFFETHDISGTKHWLEGFLQGDIIPFSIWDIDHRPKSKPEGMTYDPAYRLWVDIYLASEDSGALESVYNATTADGDNGWHQYRFSQVLGRIGKMLPRQDEFVSFSLGSPQGVSISGSADPGTTGGHSATDGKRIVSLIGVEDAVGVLWQRGREAGPTTDVGSSWANAYDGNDSNVAGQHYEAPNRPIFGGAWDDGAQCGSRGSAWSAPALALNVGHGGRGVAEPLG